MNFPRQAMGKSFYLQCIQSSDTNILGKLQSTLILSCLQIKRWWLLQVFSFQNLTNCFDNMFQAFGGGGSFYQTIIFISGIGCNFTCWHLQNYCAFLDGRKAQMPTHILALHKIKTMSTNNIPNYAKSFTFCLVFFKRKPIIV